MSLYVMDTDTLTLYQRDHPDVLQAVVRHRFDIIALPTISVDEQLNGWQAKARAARTPQQHESASELLALLVDSWGRFPLVPYAANAARRFDQLLAAKLNVGRYDLKIASIGLELGGTVVTRNRRDFGREPGLVIEDWSV